jgi:4a-hydroxytetrahydrobiopterin dehydratase
MMLRDQHCKNYPEGSPCLGQAEVLAFLEKVPGWESDASFHEISRLFSFDSYWAGLGFVNAVAWIAQAEQHHPDVALLYKKVKVGFSTHSVKGLSENDFICAAKVNALL